MEGQQAVAGSVSVDEQLGSPGWTFEKGWLAGVVVGLTVIVGAGRWRARRRTGPTRHGEHR